MMKSLLQRILLFSTLASFSQAYEFRLIASATLPSKLAYGGSSVGGLSGLAMSVDGRIYAVSDDRDQPRIYEFAVNFDPQKFKVEPTSVIKLKADKKRILDLEGIAFLPWGNFLLSSEGDQNHKPRFPPELLDAKKDATLPTTYEIPSEFIPEKSGKQKIGIRNNLGFEGLASSPNGQKWMAGAESYLLQDKVSEGVRFVEYSMPTAWVIKPTRQLRYNLESKPGDLQGGISELLWKTDSKLWVLERFANLKEKFRLKITEVDLPKMGEESFVPLQGKEILNINLAVTDRALIQNYEGLLLGPVLATGEKTLLIVSDDNFSSALSTTFLLFAFKE